MSSEEESPDKRIDQVANELGVSVNRVLEFLKGRGFSVVTTDKGDPNYEARIPIPIHAGAEISAETEKLIKKALGFEINHPQKFQFNSFRWIEVLDSKLAETDPISGERKSTLSKRVRLRLNKQSRDLKHRFLHDDVSVSEVEAFEFMLKKQLRVRSCSWELRSEVIRHWHETHQSLSNIPEASARASEIREVCDRFLRDSNSCNHPRLDNALTSYWKHDYSRTVTLCSHIEAGESHQSQRLKYLLTRFSQLALNVPTEIPPWSALPDEISALKAMENNSWWWEQSTVSETIRAVAISGIHDSTGLTELEKLRKLFLANPANPESSTNLLEALNSELTALQNKDPDQDVPDIIDDSRVFGVIASLGVPGVILWILIATSGLTGGAALTASLAVLGGPLGMLGGLVVLGLLTMWGPTIVKLGMSGLPQLLDKLGETPQEVSAEIEKMKLPQPIKELVRSKLESPDPEESTEENLRTAKIGVLQAEISLLNKFLNGGQIEFPGYPPNPEPPPF
jgi:hypothetical protein